jgi:hypothetical protein
MRSPITWTESAIAEFDGLNQLCSLGDTLNNCFMMVVSVMILFVLNETTFAVAQQSLLNDNIGGHVSLQSSLNSPSIMLESDDKHIVITWLEENGRDQQHSGYEHYQSRVLEGFYSTS